MKKYYCLSLCLFLLWGTMLPAQYSINEMIEAEDLEATDLTGNGWLRVSHGEGWPDLDHPSDFVYAMCGNRHWLCDYRTIPRCLYKCADEYIEASITIPEDGDYVIYAYVANWADSAVIEGNRGCDNDGRWETGHWYVAWDDISLLDKADPYETLPNDYMWSIYPYEVFCGTFALDTVHIGNTRIQCPNEDPTGCDFPRAIYNLTAGEHTLYLKVADEYTLIDWLWVAKDGDPAPEALPGRLWKPSAIERKVNKPEGFTLEQNYPNPFNGSTTINYFLPVRAVVNLSIYNIHGKKIMTLVNSIQSKGDQTVIFNAGDIASGTYFIDLKVNCISCDNKNLFSDRQQMTYVK